jgi:hypothetical protein
MPATVARHRKRARVHGPKAALEEEKETAAAVSLSHRD